MKIDSKKIGTIILKIVIVIVMLVVFLPDVSHYVYIFNPFLSILPMIIGIICIIILLFNNKDQILYLRESDSEYKKKYSALKKWRIIMSALLLILIIIVIASFRFFQSDKLGHLLIENNENFTVSTLVNNMEKRNITLEMAIQKAGKVMSSEIDGIQISSQYEIDESNVAIQLFQDKLVWVLPLDHKSFFSWLKQKTSPGYIIVSASDPMLEAIIINNKKMEYSSESYFFKNINLIALFSDFLPAIETHMEIDENGTPYYVILNIAQTGFYNGYMTKSVQLINAETGENTGYIPLNDFLKIEKYKWVDILTNEIIVKTSMNLKSLIYGAMNYMFIGENVMQTSTYFNSELWVIKTTQGLKWFSGMTSSSAKDDSMVYAYYVDTRNGRDLITIKTEGVMTEKGAAIAVEGKLGADAVKWSPVLPTLIENNNELFWDMIVTNDSNGVFQKYARVNAKNQSIVYITSSQDELDNNHISNDIEDEMIMISKRKYNSIIKKLKEIEDLINN